MSATGCADTNPLFESLRVQVRDNITAKAGGGQATVLDPSAASYAGYRVTTVANHNDSFTLPPSRLGDLKIVTNAAASNGLNVYPAVGEAINALGANNAFALAAGKVALFICTGVGQWHSVLTT